MFNFGSGVLLGARTDIANATPTNFGLVQDVSIDPSFDIKELYGQNQFPVAIGRGKGKFTCKAKMARISGITFANLFFGTPVTTGQLLTSFGEGPTPIPTTPFHITVTNSATFVDDYGVVNAATGLPFTKVASGPTAGQYSVAAGVYTFASADNVSGISVLINYTYTVTTAGTQKIVQTNQLLGNTPTFSAQLYSTFQGIPFNLKLNQCVASKLGFATKLDDFTIPELDFSVFADSANNIATWSFGEAS